MKHQHTSPPSSSSTISSLSYLLLLFICRVQLSSTFGYRELPHINRVFAISDLHTDNISNLSWLKDYCSNKTNTACLPGANDALIIAGDISHKFKLLKETFQIIKNELGCEIFFVPGNHEAWVGGTTDPDCSLEKLEQVVDFCQTLGVWTEHCLLGSDNECPVWITPIHGWYDGSLTLPSTQDLCADLNNWPWVDFSRCAWPHKYTSSPSSTNNPIPTPALTQHFLSLNYAALSQIQPTLTSSSPPGLITFSHFLPNTKTLPDWKDVSSNEFDPEWLDHGAAEISAKFAMVSGSHLLDSQIRSFSPLQQKIQNHHDHVHVFGHSHRPKDFVYEGIRYVHNPLGKPSERELRLIDRNVGMKLIWDTTTDRGMVKGEEIIRYWEEKGGGKMALWLNMARRKKRRQEMVRRIVQEVDRSNGR